MVIFGAGASYDSCPSLPPPAGDDRRPPLAAELFDRRKIFVDELDRFPQCNPIVPYLRHPRAGATVEAELARLAEECTDYLERHQQLAAVRFYVRETLRSCQAKWKNVTRNITNYHTLVDQLSQHKIVDNSCFVSFNYETLLEEAVWNRTATKLDDYVCGGVKIIKPHGSVNWLRRVWDRVPDGGGAHFLIQHAEKWQPSEEIIIDDPHSSFPAYAPALTIPVDKKSHFECPPGHIEHLRRCASKTNRLLIIGWRGMEPAFLDLLKESARSPLRVQIVSGSPGDAKGVSDRLVAAGLSLEGLTFHPNGFTEFVLNREIKNLLIG